MQSSKIIIIIRIIVCVHVSLTHIRLTATPTAAVMSMTSPSMLKSWCTVLWIASFSSTPVKM